MRQVKGVYRPYEQMRKKFPDGTGLLDELPSRETDRGGDEQVRDEHEPACDGVVLA